MIQGLLPLEFFSQSKNVMLGLGFKEFFRVIQRIFQSSSLTTIMLGLGLGFRGLSKSNRVRRIAGEKDGPPVLEGARSLLVDQ